MLTKEHLFLYISQSKNHLVFHESIERKIMYLGIKYLQSTYFESYKIIQIMHKIKNNIIFKFFSFYLLTLQTYE